MLNKGWRLCDFLTVAIDLPLILSKFQQ